MTDEVNRRVGTDFGDDGSNVREKQRQGVARLRGWNARVARAAYVIGNIIEQSAATENPIMISFGAEGYRWATDALVLVNAT